jgi:hypothetical protein
MSCGIVGRRVRVRRWRGIFEVTDIHEPFAGSKDRRKLYHVERRTPHATISFSVPREDLTFVKGNYEAR